MTEIVVLSMVVFLAVCTASAFFVEPEGIERQRHVPNPFGAVTRDSMGSMILPDKKRWDESPEYYAAQCEVEDYLMDNLENRDGLSRKVLRERSTNDRS